MIESVSVTGRAPVAHTPVWSDLKRLNFLFGENGAGKTTISRYLADPSSPGVEWAGGNVQRLLVYNRDVAEATILESHRIPGVFLLGSQDVEAGTRLLELEGDDKTPGEIPQANKELQNRERALNDCTTRINKAKDKLLEEVWSASEAFDPDRKFGWGRVPRNRESRLARIESQYDRVKDLAEECPSLEALEIRAATVLVDGVSEMDLLKPVEHTDPNTMDGAELLGLEVQGSKEVSLAALIERLGNRDWVDKGRLFLERSGGRCPFCQNTEPVSLAEDLAAYFDADYRDKKERLAEIADAYEQIVDHANERLDVAENVDGHVIDRAAFNSARANLDKMLEENLRILRDKRDNPSKVVTLSSGAEQLEAIAALVDATNEQINAHNELLKDLAKSKSELDDQVWEYFVRERLKAELAAYDAVRQRDGRQVPRLTARVREQKEVIEDLKAEAARLHAQTKSDRATIGEINKYLATVGFTSFTLETAETTGHYRLARAGDQSPDGQSLSEGEKTFITFLHFYYRATGSDSAQDDPSPVVLVIDDPISSLDGGIMWMVSQLVRRLMSKACAKDSHIEQVFVLTHNARFYSEVSTRRRVKGNQWFPEDGKVSHALLVKKANAPSEITSREGSPVTSAYRMLWDTVRDSTDAGTATSGLQNAMRRILETYFKHVGDRPFHDLDDEFPDPAEHDAYRALLGWANDGSHDAPWEETDFVNVGIGSDVFLEVFRKVFQATSNEGHYNMMMGAKESDAGSGRS